MLVLQQAVLGYEPGSSLIVKDRRIGHKSDVPPCISRPSAVVKIFKVQEKSFIKAVNVLMHLPANHHTGARNRINLNRRAWQWLIMAVESWKHARRHNRTNRFAPGSQQCRIVTPASGLLFSLKIQQQGATQPALRMSRQVICHSLKCPVRHKRIGVQEDN